MSLRDILSYLLQVKDFQPYYSFNPRRMHQLRIGADMLREALTLVSEREARAAQAKKNEKAVAEAAAEKACRFHTTILN